MRVAQRLALVAFLALAAGLAAAVAHAAWPSDPALNVPLCTAANDQRFPAIVSDGAGGAIVTWTDERDTIGTRWDIYAQRVNAGGVPQWTLDGVALCTATGDQVSPKVASDGVGGAIITWVDARIGDYNVYAQRVNAAGVPQWTAGGVALCTAANNQTLPAIIADGAGGAIVAWQDSRSGDYVIYAQRVNAAGLPQWTADGVALCTITGGSLLFPAMVSDGAGGAIVTWQDFRSGSSYDIYAQRVDAAGVPQWAAEGVALCTAAGYQQSPAIASDGAGGAIVAWQDGRGSAGYDIYAQRVSATGAPKWATDGVALCAAPNSQFSPAITSDGADGVIVAWQDNRTATSYDIYAQRMNAAGAPQWTSDGVALCIATGYQSASAIVSDGAGGAIVTWEDSRSGTSHIYAQRVSAGGVSQWTTDGAAVCTAANGQFSASITSDDTGGAILAWDDFRNGTFSDIYAQHVNSDGILGESVASGSPLSIAAGFGLQSVHPNPSVGELRVSFSLLDASPATLELHDLSGRLVASQSVGSLGAGAHVTSLTLVTSSLRPGVYCVSLTQRSRRAMSKVAMIR